MLLIMIRSFLSSVMAQKKRGCAGLTIVFVSKNGWINVIGKNKKEGKALKALDGPAYDFLHARKRHFARYLIQGQRLEPVIRKIFELRELGIAP